MTNTTTLQVDLSRLAEHSVALSDLTKDLDEEGFNLKFTHKEAKATAYSYGGYGKGWTNF